MTKTNCGTLALVLALSSFFGIRAYAFKNIAKNGHEVRWDRTPVKYYIQEDGPSSFKPDGRDQNGESVSLPEIIQRSFQTWKDTDQADVDFEYGGAISDKRGGDNGRNEIIFINSGWRDLDFSPPSGALAVTISTYDTSSGHIVDADIFFNDDYFNWGHIDTDSEKFSGTVVDIQNIATHEIGHLFGVDHSSESPWESNDGLRLATMYYSSSTGETFRRELSTDDQNAIKHIYPSAQLESGLVAPSAKGVFPAYGYNKEGELKVTVRGSDFGPLTMIRLSARGIKSDEVCKITSFSEDSAECVFDLYYVSGGDYDLIVSNSYRHSSVLKGAFTVYGEEYPENKSGGGCGRLDGRNASNTGTTLFGMILLIFPIGVALLKKRGLCLERSR